MGRISRGPNGPFSGKAGSYIGSNWRGIFYIKGIPKKSSKAPSVLQLAQQARFATAVNFLKFIKPVVDMGFSRVNPMGATGYNMAISHMLEHAITGTYPDLEIDYPAVVLTKGKLQLPGLVEATADGSSLKITWDTSWGKEKGSTDDQVKMVVYRVKNQNAQYGPEGLLRMDGIAEFSLGDEFKGGPVHVYLYVVDRTGKKWSNSLYVRAVNYPE